VTVHDQRLARELDDDVQELERLAVCDASFAVEACFR
jgi:hypothetical protein